MSEALSTFTEAGIAIAGVAVFVVILLVAGSMGSDGLGTTGAYTVVAGIVAYILVMAGIGYWISTKE